MNKQDAINEAKKTTTPRSPAINVYETYSEDTGEQTYEYGPVGYPGLFPPDALVIGTVDSEGTYTSKVLEL